ncbi:JAB domain-containing protein [Phenylobacterium zucineum]|nr:DNA repair protein RadC [Phenylobacterium zucineum]
MDAAINQAGDSEAAAQLSDAELVARVIDPRRRSRDSEARARLCLESCGGLGPALALADPRLERQIGAEACLQLRLVREASIRTTRGAVISRRFDANAKRTHDYLRALLEFETRESFRVIFLDASGAWSSDEELGRGTVDHAPVYVREVMREALRRDAAALVLVHNHPSGDPTPSAADVQVTSEIAAAASALGMSVKDHLVVGSHGVASFQALGLLS